MPSRERTPAAAAERRRPIWPRRALLAAASGALLSLACPPREWHLLAWVALLPLLASLRGAGPRRAFALGWLSGLSFYVLTLPWLVGVIAKYTHAGPGTPLLAFLVLAAAFGVYTGLFSAGLCAAAGSPLAVGVLAPALWVALELAGSSNPLTFPWVALGYTQYRQIPVIQIAELTGVYGVSALLVLVNASLFGVLCGAAPGRRRACGLVASVGLVGGLVLWGWHRAGDVMRETPTGRIAIGLVQGNIGHGRKWDPAFQEEIVSRYLRLTEEASRQGAALVVWPETALPFAFQANPAQRARLVEAIERIGADVAFGSPASRREGGRPVALNRAYLLRRDGTLGGFYDKRRLLPFAERVPLPRLLFFLRGAFHGLGQFAPGTEATVFSLSQARFGVVICYEGAFPELGRQLVRNGADFILNLTNDAWFGKTAAPRQHLAAVTLRAVENRVPLVRVANTGISAIVDPAGRIRWQTALFETAVRTDVVTWAGERTFYTRHGDVFAWGCLVVAAALLGRSALRRLGRSLHRRE